MKFLIIRFSSIGDIVLTTPIVRVLKNAGHEVHYITKEKFKAVIDSNPYIDRIYTIHHELSEVIGDLKAEEFDFAIDLHNNIRSQILISKLKLPKRSFNKLNIEKWILVNLKLNTLPDVHIVDRYLDTLNDFEIKNDGKGLDFFIDEQSKLAINKLAPELAKAFNVMVVGGNFFTKQIPNDIIIEIIDSSKIPFVLIGGPADKEKADEIMAKTSTVCANACGELSLKESAYFIEKANAIVSSDTGMMHIAAAFNKSIISLWGNTIPEFGMYPYLIEEKKHHNHIFEVSGLKCRPCSKIGFDKCPKKHFKCMLNQDIEKIKECLNNYS